MKRLFLLDAYALIFRAYYAFIKNPRINTKGVNTSAVFGFTNTLLELIRRENPTHLAVCFDVGRKTIRHDDFPEYKANRDETPEGIRIAVPYIHQILESLHIPIMGIEGFEADDVIGTLAKKAEKEGYTVYMMTSDKDYGQLVSENIFMYKPASHGNDIEIWGIPEIQKKFGVKDPLQVIDFLGMMGDSVDNIPGLPGIGEKTAMKFIEEFGSMENLFENTDKLKGKQKENVENNKEIGILSKKLATIITDVPVEFHEENFHLDPPNIEKVQEIFNDLEFKRLLESVYKTYKIGTFSEENKTHSSVPNEAKDENSDFTNNQKPKTQNASQLSLFDAPIEYEIVNSSFQNAENRVHLYQSAQSKMAVKLLIDKLLKQKELCFDTETTSLNTFEAQLVGISFSHEKGKAYYIPIPEKREEADEILNILKPIFYSDNLLLIGHNLKYDLKVLRNYKIVPTAKLYDTMIAHYLLNPDGKHGMDALSENYLNYQPIKMESLIGKKGKNQGNFKDVPLEIQTEYAAEDADITFQLYQLFSPQIISKNLQKLFEEIEMPLMQVLMEMELNGISLDTQALDIFSKEIEEIVKILEIEIYDRAGENFNLNSPKQLGDILFDKLKIDDKAKKTKTGQYATGEDVLLKLSHKSDIVDKILQYRQLQKLKSTYVDALPKEINKKDNRIHTTYAQTVAATGRLASNNPNLQNIPIKTEKGREVRKAFIAKDENSVLISADYSQIELRLIAEMSKDKAMMEAFKNGQDIHASTASKLFHIPLEEVTREQRGYAKTVNFGIIYGVSAFGLSDQTGLSRKEAKEMIDNYYLTYPSLKSYMDSQVQLAREQGFVETLLGRRRYLPDINSGNFVVRGHAERNAVNAPIQGTAADIIKIAMIKIQAELQQNWKTKMLLQVHDELVFESPKEEAEIIKPIIKKLMETAISTEVPLEVEVGIGKNWLEAH